MGLKDMTVSVDDIPYEPEAPKIVAETSTELPDTGAAPDDLDDVDAITDPGPRGRIDHFISALPDE